MDPVEFKMANMIDKDAFGKRADEITFCPCTRPGKALGNATDMGVNRERSFCISESK